MNIENNLDLQNVLNELKKFSKEILTLNPPLKDLNLLFQFERKYNLKLPDDFKYLLSLHNGIDLMGTSIYGFDGDENIESIYEFEHYQVVFPQYDYLVPFSNDGRGNFYCLDTSGYCNIKKSCPIVFWASNYLYNSDDQPEVTNASLSDWIKEVMIDWTLESFNYDGTEK